MYPPEVVDKSRSVISGCPGGSGEIGGGRGGGGGTTGRFRWVPWGKGANRGAIYKLFDGWYAPCNEKILQKVLYRG